MSAKISIPGGNGRMGKTLIKEIIENENLELANSYCCLLYTSPSPRDPT